jgi:DnaK suppressor protein
MTAFAVPIPAGIPGDLNSHLPQLRAALLQQRQFRVDQLSELVAREAGSSWATDAERDVSRALRAGAAAALADIETALQRMSTGQYGRCTECETVISLARLEILPAMSLCMRCQFARDVLRS